MNPRDRTPVWWPNNIGLSVRGIHGLYDYPVESMEHLEKLCARLDGYVMCEMQRCPNIGAKTIAEYKAAIEEWKNLVDDDDGEFDWW